MSNIKLKNNLIGILLSLACQVFYAQNPGFGNVTVQDLQVELPAGTEDARAVVLYRSVGKNFFYVPQRGFHVETLVYKRIRINSKEGFSYATVSRDLSKTKGARKTLGDLKGATYNLEEGKLVKTTMKASDSYLQTLNNSMDRETFTLPAVKEGSIIEYQYRVDSPFSYSLEEIALQYNIPILEQDIIVKIPEYYNYNQWIRGYLPVEPSYSTSNESLEVVYRSGENRGRRWDNRLSKNRLNYRVTTTKYHMEDVPALKHEHHIDYLDNYRSTVLFELHWVDFPGKDREVFANNWESVIKTIYAHDYFGNRLAESPYFRDSVDLWVSGLASHWEKANKIFKKVQGHMKWDGRYSIYAERPLQEVYAARTGSTGEINLTLVAMLREAGLSAHPVLISTLSNGIPLFPTINGFNYVVAAVEVEENVLLLDASNWRTAPNILPIEVLNWTGMQIQPDGTFSRVPLVPSTGASQVNVMHVTIDNKGILSGKALSTYTGHMAYLLRTNDDLVAGQGYVEKLEADRKLTFLEHSLNNQKEPELPIKEEYSFQTANYVEQIGDKLVFNPFFFKVMKDTPYQDDDRKLPLFLGFPWQTRNIINIVLPEGYEVEALPESMVLTMTGNIGSFGYQVVNTGLGQLQLISELHNNQRIIPVEKYGIIKEFYKNVAKKVAEPVVLRKIDGYEHQEVSTGGR